MKVKCIKTQGTLSQNCYIIEKEESCLVIDPGSEYEKIKKEITKKVEGILITHHHFDHVGALKEILNDFSVDVYDAFNTTEDTYHRGPFSFNVIKTIGHSKDSVTYYFPTEKIMFTGDFIFKGTVGRCDLAGGNFNEMKESIKKIKQYSDDIIIYPGHEEITTLGDEKKQNPYF